MRSPADDRTLELELGVYRVECRKSSGEWRPFATFREPHEAAAVAARLRELGAGAEARILPAEKISR